MIREMNMKKYKNRITSVEQFKTREDTWLFDPHII